jgi:Fe2+ transport system protein B
MSVVNPTPLPRSLARVLELHEDEVKRIAALEAIDRI